MTTEKRNRKALFINGNRSGYSPAQIENQTMTVGDLIAMLEDFDPDSLVFISNDNGYTYGHIGQYDMWEGQYDDHRVYSEEDDGFDEELAYSLISDLEEVA